MDYYIIYDIRIQYETHFNIRIQCKLYIKHSIHPWYILHAYKMAIKNLHINPYIHIIESMLMAE